MTANAPILIVEDEMDLQELLAHALRREGFATRSAATGKDALEALAQERPRLVLLDLMLPDVRGTDLCRRLRAEPRVADVPVIMLTARGEEIDRVVGFEVGADDYVVKSNLSMRELVLRIRAVLRRRETALADPRTRRHGPVSIDESAHRAWVGDTEIALTATEFRLLLALAGNAGRVQTRHSLLEDVWDLRGDLNTRTVDTHVKRLREKLGAAGDFIETVRGVGYRFARETA